MGTITRTFRNQTSTLSIADGGAFALDYTVEAVEPLNALLPRVQTSRHAGEAEVAVVVRNTGTQTITLRSADGATVGTVAAAQVATLRPMLSWAVSIA